MATCGSRCRQLRQVSHEISVRRGLNKSDRHSTYDCTRIALTSRFSCLSSGEEKSSTGQTPSRAARRVNEGRGQREKGRESSVQFLLHRREMHGGVSVAGYPWNCKKPRQLHRAIYPVTAGKRTALSKNRLQLRLLVLRLASSRGIDRGEAPWATREKRERVRHTHTVT